MGEERIGVAFDVIAELDRRRLIDQRRDNYSTYCRFLAMSSELAPIKKGLDASDVPWGLPVLLRRRAERDHLLRGRGVPLFTFGEVLHPLLFEKRVAEPRLIESATHLSDTVLALSVHQQLSVAAITQYSKIINELTATFSR